MSNILQNISLPILSLSYTPEYIAKRLFHGFTFNQQTIGISGKEANGVFHKENSCCKTDRITHLY